MGNQMVPHFSYTYNMVKFDFNKAALNEGFDFNTVDIDDTSDQLVDCEKILLDPLYDLFEKYGFSDLPYVVSDTGDKKCITEMEIYYIKPFDTLFITPYTDFNKLISRPPKSGIVNKFIYSIRKNPNDTPDLAALGNSRLQWLQNRYKAFPSLPLGKTLHVLYNLIEHMSGGYYVKEGKCSEGILTGKFQTSDDYRIMFGLATTRINTPDYEYKILPTFIMIYNPGDALDAIKRFKNDLNLNFKVINKISTPNVWASC